MAFVTPVLELWLEREIAQWAHHQGLIRRSIAQWADPLTTELLSTEVNKVRSNRLHYQISEQKLIKYNGCQIPQGESLYTKSRSHTARSFLSSKQPCCHTHTIQGNWAIQLLHTITRWAPLWIQHHCKCRSVQSVWVRTLHYRWGSNWHSCHWRKEGNVLFNNALNTFYLRLYGVRHMVKDHSERGNPLLPHGQLFPISSKGSFICIIPQTG